MGNGYCSSCGQTFRPDGGCWYCVPPKAIWSRVKCPECFAVAGLACEDAEGMRQPNRRPHKSRVDRYFAGGYREPAYDLPAEAQPETWPEYQLAYSIFDNAPDSTTRAELRQQISDAVRRHRAEAVESAT